MSFKLYRYLEACSIVILLINTVCIFSAWSSLPQIVPTHFDAAGNVNSYGSKSILLILLVFVYFFYGILSLVQKFPQANNYAVAITEENQFIQYALVKNFVSALKLELILLFGYMQYAIIEGVRSGFTFGEWFLPITLIVVFGTIVIYIYKSIKYK